MAYIKVNMRGLLRPAIDTSHLNKQSDVLVPQGSLDSMPISRSSAITDLHLGRGLLTKGHTVAATSVDVTLKASGARRLSQVNLLTSTYFSSL